MTSPKEFSNNLAKEIYGKNPSDCMAEGVCIQCGENAMENCYSEVGRKEFYISGLCEKCFDSIFEDIDIDESDPFGEDDFEDAF
jgi:hypothetical protein